MNLPPEIGVGVARLPREDASPPLPPSAHVHTATLGTGLGVWVQRHACPPRHVALGLRLEVGSLHEEEEERGYAHFLEHMAFSGTRRFRPEELERFFASLGTTLGHHHNATTTLECTRFTLSLPCAEPAVLQRALEVLADFAFGMSLAATEVERQRAIILEEMRARLGAGSRAQEALLAAMVPGSRLTGRHPLGTTASLRQVTETSLAAFYRRWYRPQLATLVVVGELELERALTMAEAAFAPWRGEGPPPSAPDPGVAASGELRAVALRSGDLTHLQTSQRVVHPDPAPSSEGELATRWARRLAWWILNRRLANRLADGQLPGDDARVSSSPLVKGWAVSRAVAVAPSGRVAPLLEALLVELYRARRHGFHPTELAAAKAALRAALRQGAEEYPTRPAAAVLSDLLETVPTGRPPLSPAQRLALAEKLLPDLDDEAVQRAFIAALPAEMGVLAALVPARRGVPTPTISDLLTAHQRAAATPTPPQFEPPATHLPLSLSAGTPAIARRWYGLPAVTTLHFANRATVHLCRMSQRPGRVFLTLTLPGGRIREQEGCLGITLAALAAAQRPAGRGAPAGLVRDVLENRSISLAAAADEDCVTVSVTASREEVEEALKLLHLLLTGARLSPIAFARWREGVRQREEQQRHDLQAQLAQATAALLSSGDPRLRLLTHADARALTWRHVQTWLSGEICGAPLEAALVGDMDVAGMEELVARSLGSLPQREERAAALDRVRHLPPVGGPLAATVRVPTREKHAALLLGWRAVPWQARRARHLLKLGEFILARRLTAELRERRRLTYGVDCSFSPSKAYPAMSLLAVACLLPPDRLDEAEAAVGDTVATLLAQGPRREELEAAQTFLGRAARRATEEPRQIARLLAETGYRGVDIPLLARLDEDYRTASPEEVQEVLRETLIPVASLTVRATPR
ncbi:MAG: insulinase family protein [Acidobacteriota bacterium]